MRLAWMKPAWLWQRTDPLYAQTFFWVSLGCAYWLSFGEPNYYTSGEQRAVAVSYLSFVPEEWISDRAVYTVFQRLFGVFGFLWFLQLGVPYTSWLATVCFTTQISLFQENIYYHDHIFQITNMLLILHCAWYHFAARPIRAALQAGRFWTTPLAPNWLVFLSIFYISVYYAFAGWHKMWVAGLGWVNGTSLQLWIHSWNRADFFPNSLIVANRDVATGLQAFTLFAEGFAFLGLFHPTLRTLMGILLVIFHIGQEWVFDFDFGSNLTLVGYIYLPFATWLDWLNAKVPKGRWTVRHPILRFFARRFDVFGVTRVEAR